MKKTTKIIIGLIIIVAIIAVIIIVLAMGGKSTNGKTKLPDISSTEDLINLTNKIYESVTVEMYNLDTRELDLSDVTSVEYNTGLENGEKLEYAIISEPFINSQPYSLIMAKVRDGENANEIAKTISEKINMRKWICVSAKKLYATNSGNIVFIIMSDNEKATDVYNSFKTLAGTIGQEYEREAAEEELPPDTVPGVSIPIPQ